MDIKQAHRLIKYLMLAGWVLPMTACDEHTPGTDPNNRISIDMQEQSMRDAYVSARAKASREAAAIIAAGKNYGSSEYRNEEEKARKSKKEEEEYKRQEELAAAARKIISRAEAAEERGEDYLEALIVNLIAFKKAKVIEALSKLSPADQKTCLSITALEDQEEFLRYKGVYQY